MEVLNISNAPVVFTLSGRQFSVMRLNLMELFGSFEADVKKTLMDDIVNFASRITDVKERVEFQRQAIKDMPKGKDLEDAVRNAMDSFDGGVKLVWMALNKCQKICLEDVKQLVMDPNNNIVITNLMQFITGQDVEAKKEEVELPKGAQVIEAEKKTSELNTK